MKRRAFLLSAPTTMLALCVSYERAASARLPEYPPVTSGRSLVFPHDYGAHPDFRTEWWYVTGWLQTESGAQIGFQITFFRSRPPFDDANPSRFAPRQLLFANAALSDPRMGSVLHDQRAARNGFGLAEAGEGNTRIHIDDWSLHRDADGGYRLDVVTPRFSFAFTLRPTQPVMLNGAAGYSQKGPLPSQASYYYSEPRLGVEGVLKRDQAQSDNEEPVRGRAWLDHEWSSALLAPEAVGWDWIGIHLDDGGAIMAFQIRDEAGRKFWAGGTLRAADGATQALTPERVRFTPLRWWRSPHTGARYPVAMRVEAGSVRLVLVPLMDDQEFDSRASTGAVYWEGAVTALKPATDRESDTSEGKAVGHGYLELTGYFRRVVEIGMTAAWVPVSVA
jgi:predicted secreted hydrolase